MASPAEKKVIFILGSTTTGKSRLSIDLATRFPAEVINSDKIQMYKGLNICTNKLTKKEMKGVPHHLFSTIENPNTDYTENDYCLDALLAIKSIHKSNRLPVIVGGSNSFIEALIEHNPHINFKKEYDCCFILLEVAKPILFTRISTCVHKMIDFGLIDELRELDFSNIDCNKGLYRSIGMVEFQDYFLAEKLEPIGVNLEFLLQQGIDQMTKNGCKLAGKQVKKIGRMVEEYGWNMKKINASQAFDEGSREAAERVWKEIVKFRGLMIVEKFVKE